MQCGEAKLPSAVLEKGRKRTVFHIFTRQFHITKVLINVCSFFLSCCLMTIAEYRSSFSRLKLRPFVRSVIYAKLYVSYDDLVVKKNQHSLRWFSNNIPTVDLIFHKSSLMEEREAESWVSPPACLLPPSLGSASRLTPDQHASALIYTKQMKKNVALHDAASITSKVRFQSITKSSASTE